MKRYEWAINYAFEYAHSGKEEDLRNFRNQKFRKSTLKQAVDEIERQIANMEKKYKLWSMSLNKGHWNYITKKFEKDDLDRKWCNDCRKALKELYREREILTVGEFYR